MLKKNKLLDMYEKNGGEGIKKFFYRNSFDEESVPGTIILRLWQFGYLFFMPLPRKIVSAVKRKKFSPFIKEWMLFSGKWSLLGLLFFVFIAIVNAFVKLDGFPLIYALIGFICIPFAIYLLAAISMPTPRCELVDKLLGYRRSCRRNVGIVSIESFKTIFSFDYVEELTPLSYLYHLDQNAKILFPVKLYCKELFEGYPQHSLTPSFDLNVYTNWDWLLPEDEKCDYSEYHHPFIRNDACSDDDLKTGNIHLKAAISPEIFDLFIELIEKEPSMEFEVEYLFFSKLLTGIYPIEGYDYPEGVPELLDKLNRSVNPWIKK